MKNENAPIVYKILTFSLIENFEDIFLREYFLKNFDNILFEFDEIPISILLDPLLRQIQVKEDKVFDLNIFDVEFLDRCSKHSKMNEKLSIILLDCLIKIYLQHFILARNIFSMIIFFLKIIKKKIIGPVIKIIENIIWRYIELDIFQDFLEKVLVVVVNIFEKNEQNKKNLPVFNNNLLQATDPINEVEEKEIISSQKNALIIELIRLILEMKSLEINENFIPILADLYQKIFRKTKKEHKGLLKLLSILGDPKELINNQKEILKRKNSIEFKKARHMQIEEPEDLDDTKKDNAKKSPKNPSKIKKKTEKKNVSYVHTQETDYGNETENLNVQNPKKPIQNKNKGEFLIIKNKNDNNSLQLQELHYDDSLNEEELDIMKKYGLSLKNKNKNNPKNNYWSKSHHSSNNLPLLAKNSLKKLTIKIAENSTPRQKKIPTKSHKNLANFSSISLKSEDLLENLLEKQNIEICAIEDCESRDHESINIIKKKHEHFFKLLFAKYANSTNQGGVNYSHAFRPSDEKVQLLALSDIRKMLKDFELDSFVRKDVSEHIFMKINTNILGEHRKKAFNFDAFINYLVIISKYIFSKTPFDMGETPLGLLLEEMMNLMWKLAGQKNNKQILLLFSNKNKQNIRIQILNNILKEDPESELPDVKFILFSIIFIYL